MPKQILSIFFASISLIASAAQSQAACNASLDGYVMDWSSETWASGTSNQSVTSVAVDENRADQSIDIDITGDTDRYYLTYPEISNVLIADYGADERALTVAADFTNNSEELIITMNFPAAVEDVSFDILDIDEGLTTDGLGGFRDSVIVTGIGPSGTVMPAFILTSPSVVSTGGTLPPNGLLGDQGQVGNGTDEGSVFVNFSQPVTEVIINYSNSFDPPSADPDRQGIAIYDLSYCDYRPRADIIVSKVQTLHLQESVGCGVIPGAADPDALFAVPGACMEYAVTAQNIGDGVASGLDLADILHSDLLFWNATHTGFSSGGPDFGISMPASMTDCSGGSCLIVLDDASLSPGQTGQIIIRATIK
jgi:hypothetical protein